ncbi:MAG: DNA polymerase III subunit delta [Candidatus Oleimicrobiaceae bacterium]
MDYWEVRAQIEQGRLAAVYLLLGPEDFLADDLVRRLAGRLLEPGAEQFNLDVFYAGEADASAIVNAASAYPMAAPHRLVVVKEAERLAAAGLQLLSAYARRPCPTTCLVVMGQALDLRRQGARLLCEAATVVELKTLRDSRAQAWVRSYVAEQGLSISEEALLLLHACTGNSLRALASELAKVQMNIYPRSTITEEDVAATIGVTRGFTVFDLCDSVGARDLRSAHLILRHLLEAGESPTAVLASLARHFRLLTAARGLAGAVSGEDLAEKLDVPRYFVDKYVQQSKRYSPEELRSAFELLLETDNALKTSAHRNRGRLVLELLLVRLVGERKPAARQRTP